MTTKYTIFKNKVWLDIMYGDIPMGTKCIYDGENRKDCQRWIKERKMLNENI